MPLPALSACLISLAVVQRLTRSGLLDIMGQDCIRAARTRGLPERVVVCRRAVRSVVPPVVNISGLQVGFLLGHVEEGTARRAAEARVRELEARLRESR